MREIRFRGISKNNNRWVYGFVSIDKNTINFNIYENPELAK